MHGATQGEGRTTLVIAVAILAGILLVGHKFIPAKLAHSALQDRVIEECKFGSDPLRDTGVIRGNIWEEARAHQLDEYFEKQDIKVEKSPDLVRVQLEYERPIELPGFTYVWHFEIDVEQKFYE